MSGPRLFLETSYMQKRGPCTFLVTSDASVSSKYSNGCHSMTPEKDARQYLIITLHPLVASRDHTLRMCQVTEL